MGEIMQIAPKGTTPADALQRGYVFLKCASHRARRRLPTGGAQAYWSMSRDTTYGVYAAIGFDDLPLGVTRVSAPFDDLHMCWG